MSNTQHLTDLATLSSFLLNPRSKNDNLNEVKEATRRLHLHIEDLWEQAQEESADPEMSIQEALFFARENHPSSTPDDHAFGSDTDQRNARWQQQQRLPRPPEPDDWNSPRI